MFEVKENVNRAAVAGVTILAVPFFILWLYLFMFGPNSGELCASHIAFLILAGFFALIAFGLSIPTTVRISEDSVMLLRGTSISGEVMLDEIEKVEVMDPKGDMRIEIYAGGERKMMINDVTIGSDKVRALYDELKKVSERHHFPVIEKESSLELMKEGALEKRGEAVEEMELSAEHLSGDEDLPYKVK